MDREVLRELKRLELEISRLKTEDILLRDRISVATGGFNEQFYVASSLNGVLSAGDGIDGGGTFPGTVSVSIDLSGTSGLEISSGELQLADTVAGGGLTIASKVLAVGAGNGIAVSADSIAVDLVSAWSGLEFSGADLRVNQGAAFTWAALHTYQASPSITFDPQSDQDHNLWTVNVTGTPTLSWDESEDAISQTHDLILQQRCFGFLKSQDENGRVGNGPVEYGETFGVGGVFEIAPSGALFESLSI